jgi:hypothetical protein
MRALKTVRSSVDVAHGVDNDAVGTGRVLKVSTAKRLEPSEHETSRAPDHHKRA